MSDAFPPLVQHCIVLTGPTASGKSAVAVELAELIDGEILSLDSIAVYREMNIGTAKPSDLEQARIPHHLIDLVAPTDEFSVACFLKAAHRKLAEVRERGHQAIFVGGTPMYLKGVLRGFDPGPPADWEFRRAVEADLERYGIEALRDRLRQVDPLAAHRIGPNDARRMIRALEVARSTGQPISHRQTHFDKPHDPLHCNVFSLAWPRQQLHRRIEQRVERMFQQGLVEEIRGLLQRYGQLSRTASQAVGYREVIEALEADSDLEEARQQVTAHTRQLARRQETWFRSFSEIRPIEVRQPLDPQALAQQLAAQLHAV